MHMDVVHDVNFSASGIIHVPNHRHFSPIADCGPEKFRRVCIRKGGWRPQRSSLHRNSTAAAASSFCEVTVPLNEANTHSDLPRTSIAEGRPEFDSPLRIKFDGLAHQRHCPPLGKKAVAPKIRPAPATSSFVGPGGSTSSFVAARVGWYRDG